MSTQPLLESLDQDNYSWFQNLKGLAKNPYRNPIENLNLFPYFQITHTSLAILITYFTLNAPVLPAEKCDPTLALWASGLSFGLNVIFTSCHFFNAYKHHCHLQKSQIRCVDKTTGMISAVFAIASLSSMIWTAAAC